MIPWYLLKYYAQRHSKFTASCLVLLIFNLLLFNWYHIFMILWAFVAGIIFAYSLLSPNTVLPNLFPFYSKKSKHKSLGDDELTLMKTVCTVCGLRRCPRHRPELNILAFQPWTNLDIHKSVDDALHEFFNIVLKEFVYTWYRDLSEDEEFVDELRTNFRFLASVMFRRMTKLDVPELVTKRLLRAGVQHIDLCLQAYKEAEYKGDMQQTILDFMGSNVHCAMWSRKAELEYLRRLVESLFPYILRPQALNSRSTCALVRELLSGSVLLPTMDAIANPDLINNLLLVFFDNTPPPQATEPPSPLVPFLGQFSQSRAHNQSCLRLELKDVINPECPELLYPFMQFLKSEAAVNVLQFCLACSDFNRRILNPDASQSEFVDLHMTVKDLFKNYCAPNALDRIKFDDDIVDTLREVVEGPPDQVIKLRTSAPLFKAYEHAYNLLENNFLPMFHQSDDYYSMICGDRPNASLAKQTSSFFGGKINSLRQAKKKDFTLAQFGNKLKDVFKSSDERLSNNLEPAIDGISLNSLAPSVSIEEELDDTNSDFDHSLHDLSSWRVTIPRIGARPDPENPKKQFFVFIIDIRRLDVEEGEEKKQQWTVARRYAEFYVLEQKLTEFHGELTECQLPAKKSFGTNKHEFTEGKKSDFEQYLQKLLTKPHLRNSELLYQFLTTEHEFSTSFLPGIKLGKLKTKLMKEKGQHLDEFLINFATSTEASKPRSNKLSRRGSETSLLSTSSDKLSGTHFDNNMNFGFNPPISKRDLPHQVKDIDGAFDYLLFLLKDVFRAPVWFMGLMYSARIVLKETVESYLDWHIEYKLTQVTQEHRLVSLIHLLRDVLFFDDEPPRNDEDKKIRYELAYKGLQDFLPDLLQSALGTSNTQDGCQLLLQIFQQPKLNKQLSYVLLDIFVQELFPELK